MERKSSDMIRHAGRRDYCHGNSVLCWVSDCILSHTHTHSLGTSMDINSHNQCLFKITEESILHQCDCRSLYMNTCVIYIVIARRKQAHLYELEIKRRADVCVNRKQALAPSLACWCLRSWSTSELHSDQVFSDQSKLNASSGIADVFQRHLKVEDLGDDAQRPSGALGSDQRRTGSYSSMNRSKKV